MERKDFLYGSMTAGLMLAVPLFNTACSKDDDEADEGGIPPGGELIIDMDSTQYSSLKTEGNFIRVNEIIIAHTGSGFVALSTICTHQRCTISYLNSNNTFPCFCHGSVFSSTGSVINGPATSPVKSYNVAQNGNILTITN